MEWGIMMPRLVLACTIFGTAAGLASALFWYKASTVKMMPLWEELGRPEPVIDSQKVSGWITGMMKYDQRSAELNKTAALCTAATSLFASMAMLLPMTFGSP